MVDCTEEGKWPRNQGVGKRWGPQEGWAALWEQKREDAFPGQPESKGRSGWCQGGLSGRSLGVTGPLGCTVGLQSIVAGPSRVAATQERR